LLNLNEVEYLLVGGYAVGYYGYPRATADMDIWIAIHLKNAEKIIKALKDFGFGSAELVPDLFLKEKQIIRMGLPPLRIEIITTISGVSFEDCYKERTIDTVDEIEVNIISLKYLKANKKASGRYKDLDDLEHLK
jgi:hypothetical protein